jgi:hypothetical protein
MQHVASMSTIYLEFTPILPREISSKNSPGKGKGDTDFLRKSLPRLPRKIPGIPDCWVYHLTNICICCILAPPNWLGFIALFFLKCIRKQHAKVEISSAARRKIHFTIQRYTFTFTFKSEGLIHSAIFRFDRTRDSLIFINFLCLCMSFFVFDRFKLRDVYTHISGSK